MSSLLAYAAPPSRRSDPSTGLRISTVAAAPIDVAKSFALLLVRQSVALNTLVLLASAALKAIIGAAEERSNKQWFPYLGFILRAYFEQAQLSRASVEVAVARTNRFNEFPVNSAPN
jgi:hypothetical protein